MVFVRRPDKVYELWGTLANLDQVGNFRRVGWCQQVGISHSGLRCAAGARSHSRALRAMLSDTQEGLKERGPVHSRM